MIFYSLPFENLVSVSIEEKEQALKKKKKEKKIMHQEGIEPPSPVI